MRILIAIAICVMMTSCGWQQFAGDGNRGMKTYTIHQDYYSGRITIIEE